MNQRINAELAIQKLQLEGMAEPILKELQAQGTPGTKETKDDGSSGQWRNVGQRL